MPSLTKSTKPQREKDIKREWKIFDLKNKILGRSTTEISSVLQGKGKVSYSAYLDSGDYVVVINARRVEVTGKKAKDKTYNRYSGYPSGRSQIKFKELIVRKPSEVIRHAVSGMLPKNKHRDRRLARLFIYPDEKHPYVDKFSKEKTT